MSSSTFAGIVHHERDGSLTHLPLEEVRVNAFIVDVSARVNIHQVFSNTSVNATSRAKYVFPVPARAAVCAFEMHLSDGRLLVGVAKEKERASAEHEQAAREGKVTTLLEWATDDVFAISLGSIPGGESVTVVLTYIMDLMDDESAQHIRFQLPMCVGQRYGQPPESMEGVAELSSPERVRISAYVQMKGLILPQGVTSPSHAGVTVMSYQTHRGRRSRHRVSVKFRSRQFLSRDFVLRVQSVGLDAPRCFMERDDRGMVAMQLTLMPKFDLPPLAAQEYLFLVDRSGSMGGSRIQTAKQTLILLLRTLPSSATSFNIFSFGSHCDALWSHASIYAQATLDEATHHVENMAANYGWTEIMSALRNTLHSRNSSVPTVVFVLTDGESYDIDECIREVADAVSISTKTAPLRVFTLGIGDTASTAMCEGIARAGNGVCLMTLTSEGIVGKCAKLLRAGRSFLLKNISVDWGISSAVHTTPLGGSPSVRFTAQDQIIRQAPSRIDSIYPGFRLVVFALINSDKYTPPREVVLRAQRDGTGDILSFKIPVEPVRLEDKDRRHRLIHIRAARRLIMELDDPSISSTVPEAERVASIIRLGEQYQLASRHTSFVAVDGLESDMIPDRTRRRRTIAEAGAHEDWNLAQYLQWAVDFVTIAIPTFAQTWFGPPRSFVESSHDDNDRRRHSSSPTQYPEDLDLGEDDDRDSESARTFTTLSSLEAASFTSWSETESRAPTPPLDDPEFVRSPSPDLIVPGSYHELEQRPVGYADPPPLDKSVEYLVRLQSFDGSFQPTDELAAILGKEALAQSDSIPVDKQLWATILAIAYFQRRLAGHPELLESLEEKAYEYVGGVEATLPNRMSVSLLLEKAKSCI